MTPEELDEARAEEAYRQWQEEGCQGDDTIDVAAIAARLARENWTPPEPVDPDVLAFREWLSNYYDLKGWSEEALASRLGHCDGSLAAKAFLAGARMATERERERAKVLEAYVKLDEHGPHLWTRERARKVLAKYQGEA